MVLADVQTVTGAKTFDDTKLLLDNVAGTFNGSFTNTNTANRVYTLQDAAGTIAFTSFIDDANIYTKQQTFNDQTLTDGASIAWNLETAQVAFVTLAGNRTLSNPTNMLGGGHYTITIKQDGTGSRTLVYGSSFKFAGGVAPTLTTTASAVDVMTCVSDGTVMYCSLINDLK